MGFLALLAAEEGGHHENNWLYGDLNEVWWSLAAFLVVIGLLYKLAFPAIVKAFRGRSERIERELGTAAAARAEAEASEQQVAAAVEQAEQESERILVDARAAADAMGVQLRERADEEAAQVRQRALADIESARVQAIADLRSEVSRLTLGAADAVVRRNLDEATQADLIDAYIDQVGAGR